MTDESAPGPAPKDGSVFRAIIGFLAIGAGIAGFIALFFVEVPEKNNNALMFAMGVIFAWGGAVINSEYGASATGRKIADEAVKQMSGQGQGGSA